MILDFTGGRSREAIPPMPDILRGVVWYWCGRCGCAILICPYCENASCSGGGCDRCYDVFEAAIAYNQNVSEDECVTDRSPKKMGWREWNTINKE
jgi:hypothetical protein